MANTPEITLEFHGQKYGLFLLNSVKSFQETSLEESTFNARFSSGKKKFGLDPFLNLAEWRDWTGGRGGMNFEDDATQYADGLAWTLSPGMVIPAPRWNLATGLRSENRNLPGSMTWKPLLDNIRYTTTPFSASSAYSAAHIWLFIKRVGSPLTLTLKLETAGHAAVSTTITKSITDITDYIDVFEDFAPASPIALTSGATYYLTINGDPSDNGENHWEIGVNASAPGTEVSASGGSWTNAFFNLYYRVTSANVSFKPLFFEYKGDTYLITRPATGASILCKSVGGGFDASGLGTSGLGLVTGRPIVSNSKVYFPQGESVAIRRWDGATTWAADGSNKATLLTNTIDDTLGGKIARANNASGAVSISEAPMVSGSTNLTFATAVGCGDATATITNLLTHQNKLYVFKEDSIGIIVSGKYSLQESNLKFSSSLRNGAAVCSWNGLLYYSWLNTMMESYAGNANDIGQSWRGTGPEGNRVGYFSAILGINAWRICAIDGGATGYSCIMIYNGTTWHEIYRAPYGHQIRDIWWHHVDGGHSMLFIDIDYDVVYLEFPKDVAGPTHDLTHNYAHSFYMVTPTFDDGAARLPKYLKSIALSTSNCGDKTGSHFVYFELDYQTDNDVGLDGAEHWFKAGRVYTSPEGKIRINKGNCRCVRFRIRGYTNLSTVPAKLDAITLDGFTRTPARTQWTMTVSVGDRGAYKKKASEILKFLQEASISADDIIVTSTIPELNGRHVIANRPKVSRALLNPITALWTGTLVIALLDMSEL